MSSTFSITNTYIFRASNLEQIRKAYNQRRAAVHQSARYWSGSAWGDGDTALSAGTAGQSHNLVAEMQTWITNNCGLWMPPDVSTYDNTEKGDFKAIAELAADAGQADFEYFCKTIVGGNLVSGSEYGFRRYTKDGAWLRGTAQSSDLWHHLSSTDYYDAWQDVRACLSAMKVTRLSGTSTYGDALALTTNGSTLKSVAYGDASSAASFASQYDASGSTNSAAPFAESNYYSLSYFGSGNSCKLDCYVPGTDASLISSVDVYIESEPIDTTFYSHGQNLYPDKLGKVASFTPSVTGAQATPELCATSGADFTFDLSGSYDDGWQTTSDPYRALINWDFTNADA
jgi:hypothetical protein